MPTTDKKRPELLSPAGDEERLTMSLTYGADAVYLAAGPLNMRASAGSFAPGGALEAALEQAHGCGAKVYITCNTVPHNEDFDRLPEFLEQVGQTCADGLIVSDVGVMAMARRYAPKIPLHVSTQAGVAGYASANAFYDMGAKRVILARELTLREIAELREKTSPDLEIEAFVHGAMCMSFSGRCLLSNYLTGRDGNRGRCAQPCRWKYHVTEQTRPGQFFELSEDGGTYLFNSRDLCMIGHLREIIDAGVDSLKLEGRMKSAYYAAVVTNAYRHALDDVLAGREVSPVWLEEVNAVSHRPYSTGFFFDEGGPGQSYASALYESTCEVVGVVEQCDPDGWALATQRNKFLRGDTLELVTPDREPVSFPVTELFDGEGQAIDDTRHPMMPFRLRLPFAAEKNALLRRRV